MHSTSSRRTPIVRTAGRNHLSPLPLPDTLPAGRCSSSHGVPAQPAIQRLFSDLYCHPFLAHVGKNLQYFMLLSLMPAAYLSHRCPLGKVLALLEIQRLFLWIYPSVTNRERHLFWYLMSPSKISPATFTALMASSQADVIDATVGLEFLSSAPPLASCASVCRFAMIVFSSAIGYV